MVIRKMNVSTLQERGESDSRASRSGYQVRVPGDSVTKGILRMIRSAARRVVTRKAIALWSVVRYSVAGIYFWIGGSYLFGAHAVRIDPAFRLLENVEPGGIRMHGLILCALAFVVAAKPGFHFMTQLALMATLFYSVLTAFLILGGWTISQPDITGPAWYVFVAVLSFALIVTSPASSRGPRHKDGGARA